MQKTWLLLFVIVTTALAGCAKDDAGGQPQATDTSTTTGTTNSTNTAAPPAPWVPRELTLAANQTEGNAPLAVTFDVDATGWDANTTYRLAHGDGTDQGGNASDLPLQLAYTYEVGGTFDAVLEVAYHNETRTTNVTITVQVEDVREAPDVLHFEYGRSLGCWWDLTTIPPGGPASPCISQEAGPSGPAVDGFWQPLDERYWNLEFTSTVDHGEGQCSSGDDWPLCDSDCFFYGESTSFGDEIGNGNNGGGACAGVVPEGTAWLFIFPYGGPSQGMVLDFVV